MKCISLRSFFQLFFNQFFSWHPSAKHYFPHTCMPTSVAVFERKSESAVDIWWRQHLFLCSIFCQLLPLVGNGRAWKYERSRPLTESFVSRILCGECFPNMELSLCWNKMSQTVLYKRRLTNHVKKNKIRNSIKDTASECILLTYLHFLLLYGFWVPEQLCWFYT